MLKKMFLAAVLCSAMLQSSFCNAQDITVPKELYNASSIPDSLKEDANAVVRYSTEEVTFKSAGKAILKRYSLVTILNEKADDEARLVVSYERKYNSISTVWMKVYNASGTLIKKYNKSDMYDRSASDESTIVTDDRYLVGRHTVASYPITIETFCETDFSSYINLGPWEVQDPDRSVQTTTFKAIVSPALNFRFKSYNFDKKPVQSSENGMNVYAWQAKNLKAFKPEEYAPEWCTARKICFATDMFQCFGIPGDISSWRNFGKWAQALNADVCSLSPQREDEIRAMTANLKTDKEKARFLYNYLQHNVRYVSVQLGIGGFKPFPASFVDQKKYGDCKALSNYMYALLKAVNIPSYYAFVNAGTNGQPADNDFAFDTFNHAILCIPFKNDTTWLECTSNKQPFGKLGTFTENRKALLITPEGGKLVSTPLSTVADNKFTSNVSIKLDADGHAKAQIKIFSTGEYRALYLDLLSQKTEDQKEFLIRNLHIKQPISFVLNTADDKDGVKEVDAELEYDRYYDIAAGEKQFYKPHVFDLWGITLPAVENRKADFYFEHPMEKTCTTSIDLPSGFELEALPVNVDLKFSYGNYVINYKYDPAKNQVVSVATFKLTTQHIPAVKYTEMQQYMDAIAKAQNRKLVIRHKAA